MINKVNYIHAINFTKTFRTPRNQGNYKNNPESRKKGLRFLPKNSNRCTKANKQIY